MSRPAGTLDETAAPQGRVERHVGSSSQDGPRQSRGDHLGHTRPNDQVTHAPRQLVENLPCQEVGNRVVRLLHRRLVRRSGGERASGQANAARPTEGVLLDHAHRRLAGVDAVSAQHRSHVAGAHDQVRGDHPRQLTLGSVPVERQGRLALADDDQSNTTAGTVQHGFEVAFERSGPAGRVVVEHDEPTGRCPAMRCRGPRASGS